MTATGIPGNVCVDCLMYLANGEPPDQDPRTGESWSVRDIEVWITKFHRHTEGVEITLGWSRELHASDCDAEDDCECEQTAFSSSSCSTCNSSLAGSRDGVTLWVES